MPRARFERFSVNGQPGVRLEYRRLDEDGARAGARARGRRGLDLHANEAAHIDPGERASVGTGIAVAIPDGHAGLVVPRSGLAAKHGITLVNTPGLIDAGYRGEVRVLLLNTDRDEVVQGRAGRPDRAARAGEGRVAGAGRGGGAVRDDARRGRLRLDGRVMAADRLKLARDAYRAFETGDRISSRRS